MRIGTNIQAPKMSITTSRHANHFFTLGVTGDDRRKIVEMAEERAPAEIQSSFMANKGRENG
jgi:hypothetical protein